MLSKGLSVMLISGIVLIFILSPRFLSIYLNIFLFYGNLFPMLHVEDCVREVANTFSFEKVSDLSKEDFIKLLSQSIEKVICSSDFTNQVESDLSMNQRRRRR